LTAASSVAALPVAAEGINGNGLEQFEHPGTQVVLFPLSYKSGSLEYLLPQR